MIDPVTLVAAKVILDRPKPGAAISGGEFLVAVLLGVALAMALIHSLGCTGLAP